VEQHPVFLLRLGVSREDQQPPISRRHPHIHHLKSGHLFQHRSSGQPRRQSPQALPQRDIQTVGQERYEDMCLDARILLVMNGSDGQIVLQSAKDRFDLRELNLVSPQHGRIFPAKIRAQQIMTFAAKGLPELVLSQGEGERLRVDRLLRLRHLHFHQVIDATRLGFGGSQFHAYKPAWPAPAVGESGSAGRKRSWMPQELLICAHRATHGEKSRRKQDSKGTAQRTVPSLPQNV